MVHNQGNHFGVAPDRGTSNEPVMTDPQLQKTLDGNALKILAGAIPQYDSHGDILNVANSTAQQAGGF